MVTLKGIPVSPGITVGKAFVLDSDDIAIEPTAIDASQVEAESQRLDNALHAAASQVRRQREETAKTLGTELAAIFGFHEGMLQDRHLTQQIRDLIEKDLVQAEYATYAIFEKLANTFRAQENVYFQERVTDLNDLRRRVMRHLRGEGESNDLQRMASQTEPVIIISHDLTPSQTASYTRDKVLGMAIDLGGRTSHTAILAHALGIPAVVGLEEISRKIRDGQTIIVDGNTGAVIIDPPDEVLADYKLASKRVTEAEEKRRQLSNLPAETTDGTLIQLTANIEFPAEIPDAIERGAQGIGLYRTEYLFLGADHEPSEEEQYQAYREAIESLGGRGLTFRTLDLGADKQDASLPALKRIQGERNPFLGCRSIRLCLQNLDLFRTQLRAILRASAHGPVRIMFPLITNTMEFRQANLILHDMMDDLADNNIAFDPNIKVGMMVEVPSAAIQATSFAREADFFSIGTNDLIQYVMATDRGNERIANLYAESNPAVLSLLRDIVRAANLARIDVSICGEMAGNPIFIPLLLGLGLRSLSITPPAIPMAKELVRSLSLTHCNRIAQLVLKMHTDREILTFLEDEFERIMPAG